MLIVACQKCGEPKILAGSPDSNGVARAVWTCKKCGAGQVMELAISKDARRGDLHKIIGGLALAGRAVKMPKLPNLQESMEDFGDEDMDADE